jgi:hypothetical protein
VSSETYDYVYRWGNNGRRRDLKGKRCRLLAQGSSMHSVLIELEDGEKVITSRRAIKKRKVRADDS